ncbi:MAG: hypothetical protein NT049_02110 [Planctomycetota bacterium]|nr:hypothetical protein [Planctomycetota bacterium]
MLRKNGVAAILTAFIGLALVVAPAFAYAKKDKGAPAAEKKVTLPEGAAKAVKEAFPTAVPGAVKMENEGGMLLYAVELWEGSAQKSATVAYDGTIAGVKMPLDAKDVPEAAAKAIRSADDAAIVAKFNKVEMRAEVKQEDGAPKLVKCDPPKAAFEGVLAKNGLTGHIKVAENGTVITSLVWDTTVAPPAPTVKSGKTGKKNK